MLSANVSTLNRIHYLISFNEVFFVHPMRQRDLRQNRALPINKINNSYDMEEFAMPLHEFINHPVVEDIIHNGATFQVVECVSFSLYISFRILTSSHIPLPKQ